MLADQLSNEHSSSPFLAIFSSPLLRATQSAQIFSDRLGIPYETADALIEYDVGVYEGRPDEEAWQRYGEVLREWLLNCNRDVRMEGGESFNDVRARFLPFIEELKRRYGDGEGSLILVGHGGTYRCMLPLILQNVDFLFAAKHMIGNTSYILADLEGVELVCSSWGDIQFETPRTTG